MRGRRPTSTGTLARAIPALLAAALCSETMAFSLGPALPAMRLRTSTSARLSSLTMNSSPKVSFVRQTDASTKMAHKQKTLNKYCESVYKTERRKTRTVHCGDVPIGSEHPVALQTMTTALTTDVQGSIDQVMRCADAGAQLVRLTVQGQREADATMKIKEGLLKAGYTTPLVADIHFAPKIAMQVCEAFDKIRINPGNFADGRKTFKEITYEDPKDYQAELDYIEETFTPLVLKCKELGRAMRIGTNHGSLSARTLSYYGDTPQGMVESAFEFARICRKHDYHNFLFSMKASNPKVMVAAYRLLAAEMYSLDWDYPLHLGVTEAGEGEDGRMKSAIGIGSLLQDGLGDTIRVSLTEDPWLELDPAGKLKAIANAQLEAAGAASNVPTWRETTRDFKVFSSREVELPVQKESDNLDMRNVLHRDGSVISAITLEQLDQPAALYAKLGCKTAVGFPFKDIATSDSVFIRTLPAAADKERRLALRRLQEVGVGVLAPIAELTANPLPDAVAVVPLAEMAGAKMPEGAVRMAVTVRGDESDELLKAVASSDAVMILLEVPADISRIHASRRVFEAMKAEASKIPVIHHTKFTTEPRDELVLTTGSQVGCSLVDGNGEGVLIESPLDLEFVRLTSFGLLQGSRMRNIKTEYVSCPSCGRTLFDLQEVTAKISEATGHLPGVTIAVMGCIVNGPGEMADADFGYVGGAPGKIDLYVGKTVVRKAIPSAEACDELIQLIKDNDRWVEKEVEEEAVAA